MALDSEITVPLAVTRRGDLPRGWTALRASGASIGARKWWTRL